MIEPVLDENGKKIPLKSLTYEQCERLHGILSEKFDIAFRCGMSGVEQLGYMIDAVEERMQLFENGFLKRTEEKKPTYKYLKIDD